MIQLFLSPGDPSVAGDDESANSAISLLNQLEPVIWSAIAASGCRSEARLWLCNSVSRLSSPTRRDRRDIFVSLLKSKPRGKALASQLLQLMFEKKPRIAGPVLARRSHLLEQFFKGNPRRIFDWFSGFDVGGGSNHKRGAKALSQFAFANRDICWDELEWKGKHGQSPAMVATKPHYFLDLDINQTVENFVEYVPEFWSSSEFAETLRDGEILSIDSKYFVELFVGFMYKEEAGDVWEAVSDFLMEEPFSSLCQRLLIGLEESDLSVFLELLSDHLRPMMEYEGSGDSTHWLETALSESQDFKSIDLLLLLNATIGQRRQLLRIINDDECMEEKKRLGETVSKISKALSGTNSFLSFLKECGRKNAVESIRLIGLQSWVLYYRLSEECLNTDSWESLFSSNDIEFRKSGNYSMVRYSPEGDSGSELDDKLSMGSRRKKKHRKRNKRKRNYDFKESCEDILDTDTLNNGISQGRTESWSLSTDEFSGILTIADLPEHLSKQCFSAWMNCIHKKFTRGA